MVYRKCFVIVGAGDLSSSDLNALKKEDGFITAADGGYLPLLQAGIQPDLIIGDFDSAKIPETGVELIRLPVVKDDTDMVYCVKEGLKRGYRSFRLYGALGGRRISHTIANLQLLSMIHQKGAEGDIVSDSVRVFLMNAGDTRVFSKELKGTVSFFSISDRAILTLKGLDYELERGELRRDFPLGVSNHFIGQEAQAEVFEGEVLGIVEEGMM